MPAIVGIAPGGLLVKNSFVRVSLSGNLLADAGVWQAWWDACAASQLGIPASPRPGDQSGLTTAGKQVIDVHVTTGSLTAEQYAGELNNLLWTVDVDRLELLQPGHAGNVTEIEQQRQQDQQTVGFWGQLEQKLGAVGKWALIALALVAAIVLIPRFFGTKA